MVLSTRPLALAASLASLLFSITITASPLEHEKRIDVVSFGSNPHKRQDPGPGGGAVDPSGIEPEDEDTAQIAADGTGPLRSGTSFRSTVFRAYTDLNVKTVPARKLYTNQATATWRVVPEFHAFPLLRLPRVTRTSSISSDVNSSVYCSSDLSRF